MITKEKGQTENLDYYFDWSKEMDSLLDTIVTSQIVVSPGLTVGVTTNTSKRVTVWLSGGVSGSRYMVTNRIVTAAGRHYDRSFWLKITAK
jgi:hypothetical protein